MKRQNNSGSVTKLSGNRRKPYLARVIRRNAAGARVWVSLGTYCTAEEARVALAQSVVTPVSSDASITLEQLYNHWVTTQSFLKLAVPSQNGYNNVYNKYMLLYRKRRFVSLKLMEWQSMVDVARDNGRGLSTCTKIKCLSTILGEYAYENDIVNKVYAHSVKLPHVERKSIDIFTDLDIKKLWDNVSMPYVDSILMLIYTGLRINELLSLTKFDVDLSKMIIVGGSKTNAGKNRIVPIHSNIQPFIAARVSSCNNYLFECDDCSPITYAYYTKHIYYNILSTLGIARLTPHRARHTFFTIISDRCTDRKAMAMIGGHTNPNFTDKTYVQPDLERLRHAIECM